MISPCRYCVRNITLRTSDFLASRESRGGGCYCTFDRQAAARFAFPAPTFSLASLGKYEEFVTLEA